MILEQSSTRRVPNGAKRVKKAAKRTQKGAEGTQKGAKGDKREPKCDQNAYKNRYPKKGAKKEPGQTRLGSILGPFSMKNAIKNQCKNQWWKKHENA